MTNQQQPPCAPKIAIIGGGLTGLLTATLLERALYQNKTIDDATQQADIHIFEKSRSVGRLATRYRRDEGSSCQWQWAFGAQFFTAKSEAFQAFLAPWLASGLIQPWRAQVVDLTPNTDDGCPRIDKKEQWDNAHARYISSPKMTSWGRQLADELRLTTIHFKTRVRPLGPSRQATDSKTPVTELFDEAGGYLGEFDWVICTAPNGQAAELLIKGEFAKFEAISTPQMQACYSLMLGWDQGQVLPPALQAMRDTDETWDVAEIQDSVLSRAFVEHRKPARKDLLPSVTIHARNDWSEAHVDDDIDAISAQLLSSAQQALGWDDQSAPTQTDTHRWRYAATVSQTTDTAQGILVDTQQQWIVSGDWCGQGNIESCYHAAADTVRAIMAG